MCPSIEGASFGNLVMTSILKLVININIKEKFYTPLGEWNISIQGNLVLVPLQGHLIGEVVGLAIHFDPLLQERLLRNEKSTVGEFTLLVLS
ncbi:hypothetical protein E2C01_023238 [Portunus trituberculatus]|uniref:Uncharacterized protein n=1 Tax=Portunus trituberculatus TaxID=210409 RepID=A0A5B7E9H5_PORTR|nr:hypothetical protein [Portunus trituberculatus]